MFPPPPPTCLHKKKKSMLNVKQNGQRTNNFLVSPQKSKPPPPVPPCTVNVLGTPLIYNTGHHPLPRSLSTFPALSPSLTPSMPSVPSPCSCPSPCAPFSWAIPLSLHPPHPPFSNISFPPRPTLLHPYIYIMSPPSSNNLPFNASILPHSPPPPPPLPLLLSLPLFLVVPSEWKLKH